MQSEEPKPWIVDRLCADWLLETHVWLLCLELRFSRVPWTVTSLSDFTDVPTMEEWLNDMIGMEHSGHLIWPHKYLPGEECLTSSWSFWRLSEKVIILSSDLTITRCTVVTANPVCLIQRGHRRRKKERWGRKWELVDLGPRTLTVKCCEMGAGIYVPGRHKGIIPTGESWKQLSLGARSEFLLKWLWPVYLWWPWTTTAYFHTQILFVQSSPDSCPRITPGFLGSTPLLPSLPPSFQVSLGNMKCEEWIGIVLGDKSQVLHQHPKMIFWVTMENAASRVPVVTQR